MPTRKEADSASARTVSAQPGTRKPWKKKTPEEVVIEQTEKLRFEIAQAEDDLKQKRKQLAKFEEACKIFESA